MAPVQADDRTYRRRGGRGGAYRTQHGFPLLTQARGLARAGESVQADDDDALSNPGPVPFDEAVARSGAGDRLEDRCRLRHGATKMFCGSPVTFGAEPDSAVLPVCLGLLLAS